MTLLALPSIGARVKLKEGTKIFEFEDVMTYGIGTVTGYENYNEKDCALILWDRFSPFNFYCLQYISNLEVLTEDEEAMHHLANLG